MNKELCEIGDEEDWIVSANCHKCKNLHLIEENDCTHCNVNDILNELIESKLKCHRD